MTNKTVYTSYYAKMGKHPLAISVSVVRPRWLPNIAHLPELAPPAYLLRLYKEGRISEEEYVKAYHRKLEMQNKSPQQVLDMIPDGGILCCYEKPPAFCHRHIAAAWLWAYTGTKIEEV